MDGCWVDCNPVRREAVGRLERRVVAATVLTGSQVSQGAVGPLLVVFHTPAFHDDPSFKQGAKELPIEAFIAELVMEAFDVAVLIRLSPHPSGPPKGGSMSPLLHSHGEPGVM